MGAVGRRHRETSIARPALQMMPVRDGCSYQLGSTSTARNLGLITSENSARMATAMTLANGRRDRVKRTGAHVIDKLKS